MNKHKTPLTKQELLDLKQEIDETKPKVSEIIGQQKTLFRQLKEQWNCTTLDIAKKKIETWETEVVNIDSKIKTKSKELEDKL